MKISATVGVTTYDLTEESGFPLSCVSNLRITSGIQVQEDPIVRSAVPFKAGRSNMVMEASFSVVRTHASVNAAYLWSAGSSVASILRWNNVATTVILKDPSGTELDRWSNCEIKETIQIIGSSTISSYTIRGVPTP